MYTELASILWWIYTTKTQNSAKWSEDSLYKYDFL